MLHDIHFSGSSSSPSSGIRRFLLGKLMACSRVRWKSYRSVRKKFGLGADANSGMTQSYGLAERLFREGNQLHVAVSSTISFSNSAALLLCRLFTTQAKMEGLRCVRPLDLIFPCPTVSDSELLVHPMSQHRPLVTHLR